jgi:hypothetical protein
MHMYESTLYGGMDCNKLGYIFMKKNLWPAIFQFVGPPADSIK